MPKRIGLTVLQVILILEGLYLAVITKTIYGYSFWCGECGQGEQGEYNQIRGGPIWHPSEKWKGRMTARVIVRIQANRSLVGGTTPRTSCAAPDLTSGEGVVSLKLLQVQRMKEDFVWLRYEVCR